ncbi:peptidylprolyl isomerase [Paraburkholderia dinghuensis]|uniref:peptidylprolyl isomerase n=1 Tax=Paraburkholderia dinghuensis TaxID=2305225 RepID=UPI0016299B52|nr:peptidyl-prolyl cis-trans isomerase [Paraburkholderia dinghuensis]
MKFHLDGSTRLKVRSRSTTMIRAACAVAFASVAIAATVPVLAHAASSDAVEASRGSLPAGAFAVVNGVALPQTQLDALAQALALRTGQPVTVDLRDSARQQLIVREVLRQAAEKASYGTRPEVQDAAHAAAVDVETQLYVRDHARPAPVTDAQVKARYDAAVATLGPVEYKWRLITVRDAAAAQRAMADLKSGQDFGAVALEYSTAPSKGVGGEMPWVSFPQPLTEGKTQGLPLPLAQAIVALPVGGVTPEPVHAGDVWFVAKLDSKRAMKAPALNQIAGDIRQQLEAEAQEQAVTQLTESLSRGATVQQ